MKTQTKQMDEQEALARLTALCSQAEHSSGEMREKMRRWHLAEDIQDRIMARLIDEKYIDDERYSRAFAHDKVSFDKWGRRKIEAALYKKGVGKAVFSPVLDNIDESEYVKALRGLIAAKRQNTVARNEYEMNGKLIKYALGRGFTFDVIKKCIGSADEYDIADGDN